MAARIPRVRPGQAITAEQFNALADAVERAQPVAAAGGSLETRQTAAGTAFRALFGDLIVLAQVGAGGVAARSGTTLGSGTGQRFTLTGTGANTLTAVGSAGALALRNLLNKTVAANSYVVAVKVLTVYVVVAVDDCTHLS